MDSTVYRRLAIAKGRYALIVLFILSTLLVSCADLAYYGQAINGHWAIMQQRQSLAATLNDQTIETELRRRLTTVQVLRDFASTRLLLPDNDSYRSYVDLGRPYVVHNVFAAPARSLQPHRWCFLVVGCVSYRGYFDQSKAEQLSDELRGQGYDTYVANIPAYSTLGWFEDPLLNTFIHWPEGQLAELIFHELAHQRLFIDDDTQFNESFATTVGRIGAELWLHDKPEAYTRYRRQRRYREAFLALVLPTKEALSELYTSSQSQAAKNVAKQGLLRELQARYEAHKRNQWDGFSGYDVWFTDVNNAKLSALSAYDHYVPAFEALYAQVGQDFAAFYHSAETLSQLPPAQRSKKLQDLMTQRRLTSRN